MGDIFCFVSREKEGDGACQLDSTDDSPSPEPWPQKYTLILRLLGQSLNVPRDKLKIAVCFIFLPKFIIKNNCCLLSA